MVVEVVVYESIKIKKGGNAVVLDGGERDDGNFYSTTTVFPYGQYRYYCNLVFSAAATRSADVGRLYP